MAFCLPTTYFTSALFSSLVVGFCSGHSLGLGFERCFFHYQWATFRNLSELWKNFNEPARWAVDKNPPCLLGDNPLLFFRLLQYKLISCVIELFVRRNSPRSTLVWKAVWATTRHVPTRWSWHIYLIPLWLISCSYKWPSVVQEVSICCAHLSPNWAIELFCASWESAISWE